MLIHGAWLSSRSWDNYADYFGKRGFAVSAPEWPRKHGDVEEMRETAEESAGLGVQEIVDHYAALIGELDQPPVLIGHSYGGLFVELLLDRGLGRAGVAMSPAPAKGILALPLSTLKAGAPALAHPSKWHGVVELTAEEFTYAFVNTFSPRRTRRRRMSATPFRRPGRSSTRRDSRTSTCTHRPRCISRTQTGRRCCSSRRPRTTPCRPR
jgi:pimeloyl-ACP methyl ester carboxylesterase